MECGARAGVPVDEIYNTPPLAAERAAEIVRALEGV